MMQLRHMARDIKYLTRHRNDLLEENKALREELEKAGEKRPKEQKQ